MRQGAVGVSALIGLATSLWGLAAWAFDPSWATTGKLPCIAAPITVTGTGAGAPLPLRTATVQCRPGDNGMLTACRVLEEAPAGGGMSVAAIKVAGLMHNPVACRQAEVMLPLIFGSQSDIAALKTSNAATTFPGHGPHAAWISPPRPAFPSRAAEKGATGTAVVACMVLANGGLIDCAVVAEQPQGLGFGEAALKSLDQARLEPVLYKGIPTPGGPLYIPFRFALSGITVSQPE